MKKLIAVFLTVCACAAAFAAENKAPRKSTIAVAKVSTTPSLAKAVETNGGTLAMSRILEAMDANLSAAVQATRKFEVLTRSDIDAIVKEQSFAESGNVDSQSGQAAKIGKIKGAQYLLVVAVDDFQDYKRKRVFAGLGESTEVRIIRLGAVAKIVDSTTGAILETADFVVSGEGRSSEIISAAVSGGGVNDAVIASLTRKMCALVANRVADAVFPAKIIAKTGKIATFNRGDGTGVCAGDEYDIFALGENMVDPDTGENLGAQEVRVGHMRVSQALPKFSNAVIDEDNGVEKGQVVRLVKKAKKPAADSDDDEF